MALIEQVSVQVAGEEVNKWLDFKRVKPSQRAVYARKISTLIEAVMYGNLVIKPDFSLVHNLNFPLEILNADKSVASTIDTLEYKARLTAKDISECMNGNIDNEMDNTIAYGAALSGEATGLMAKLDTSDIAILSSVGVFFT